MDKNGKYWGFYVAERSDQRYNTTKVLEGDIILIYEYNISHSSWLSGESWPLYLGVRLILKVISRNLGQRDVAECSKDILSFDQLHVAAAI